MPRWPRSRPHEGEPPRLPSPPNRTEPGDGRRGGRHRGVRRRSTPFDWLVVGLGNPGKDFARTRHNIGEEVVTELARRRGDTLKSGRDNALVAESRIDGVRWVLAFPLTYVNESGLAVRSLVRRYGIEEPDHIIVVHDELDLPPALLRVKVGGGLGRSQRAAQHQPAPRHARLHAHPHRRRQAAVQGAWGRPRPLPAAGQAARAVRRRRAGRRRRSRRSSSPAASTRRCGRTTGAMPEGDTIRRLAERISTRFAGQRCQRSVDPRPAPRPTSTSPAPC